MNNMALGHIKTAQDAIKNIVFAGRRGMALLCAGLLALALAALPWPAGAQDGSGAVQPVPPLTARIVDQTGSLDAGAKAALEAKLADYEKTKGTQIVLLMVPTTQPEDIASYAYRVASTWKIGRRDVGDGLLVVVALNDRKVRIEVAKALEGAVPDLAARRIIDSAIKPAFKRGDYAGGLAAAFDQLFARLNGEALPDVQAAQGGDGEFDLGSNLVMILLMTFFFLPIASTALKSILGHKLGAIATGAGAGYLAWLVAASLLVSGAVGVAALLYALLASSLVGRGASSINRGGGPIIWGGGGGGGNWGGGGFGGGGFSSGGGGDFGGGGASGDW